MSVMTTVYRLTEREAAQFMDAPDDVASELLYGEDGWDRPGLAFIKWFAFEKHGGGVHLALAGLGNARPLCFLGDESFGDETAFEFAYGPGRLFAPEIVRSIDKAITALPAAAIAQRLTIENLASVYPFTLRAADQDDVAMVSELVTGFAGFVSDAARAGDWLMVTVY